jgi:cytochrome c553
MRKSLRSLIVSCGVCFAAPSPLADDAHGRLMTESDRAQASKLSPNVSQGREVFEVCTACHMPEGWGRPDGSFPQLSGQHRSVIIKELLDIAEGSRANPAIHPFGFKSEIGGPQGLADVAGYVAGLPMAPTNGVGDGDELALGEKIYMEACASCHGQHGEGDESLFLPRLQGQHYEYMRRQFRWIRTGRRRNANPAMAEQIASLSDKDERAVLDYVSRLRPPPEMIAPAGWRNPDFH